MAKDAIKAFATRVGEEMRSMQTGAQHLALQVSQLQQQVNDALNLNGGGEQEPEAEGHTPPERIDWPEEAYGSAVGYRFFVDDVEYITVSDSVINGSGGSAAYVRDGDNAYVGAFGINWYLGKHESKKQIFTGNITNFSNVFTGSNSSWFNGDIGYWDMSNATVLNSMFWNITAFNQDISGWDVSSATNMVGMFENATAFDQDIGGWDTSSVADMTAMFRNASAFNQDISGWDVGSVVQSDGFRIGSALTAENSPFG